MSKLDIAASAVWTHAATFTATPSCIFWWCTYVFLPAACMCWKCILGSDTESRIQCQKYTPLAIVHLTQPPIPLPGNPRWSFSLPGKTALIKDQSGFQEHPAARPFYAQSARQIHSSQLHLMSAWLHSLVINFAHFAHTQHIRPLRLKQSAQSAVKCCRRISRVEDA